MPSLEPLLEIKLPRAITENISCVCLGKLKSSASILYNINFLLFLFLLFPL